MNSIDYSYREQVYRKAINKYGTSAQLIMVIEEMSELTKSLCKFFRNGYSREMLESIADECADVTIMLEQLRIIFDMNDMVCQHMDAKVERLNKRLEGREPG